MDAVESLARDLARAVPVLHDVILTRPETWQRIILAAVDSNAHLELLTGNALTDRALGVVASLREAREHAPVQGNGVRSSAVVSSPAMTRFGDFHSPTVQLAGNARQFE